MSFESDMEQYRNPSNGRGMSVVWGDAYYRMSLVKKYGEERVEKYLRKHPFIKDLPEKFW